MQRIRDRKIQNFYGVGRNNINNQRIVSLIKNNNTNNKTIEILSISKKKLCGSVSEYSNNLLKEECNKENNMSNRTSLNSNKFNKINSRITNLLSKQLTNNINNRNRTSLVSYKRDTSPFLKSKISLFKSNVAPVFNKIQEKKICESESSLDNMDFDEW